MAKKVRDVMRHGVVTCQASSNLSEVAKIMMNNKTQFVLVVDEMGEACGQVRGFQLLKYFGQDLSKIPVEEVMEENFITISPHADLPEAVSIMLKEGIECLIIVHDIPSQPLKPVGTISLSEIIAEMT